jgi:hypothetical protein
MRALVVSSLIIAGLALGQTVPVPGTNVSSATQTGFLDAGSLQVHGPQVNTGTLSADAGSFAQITFPSAGTVGLVSGTSELDIDNIGTSVLLGVSTSATTAYSPVVTRDGLTAGQSGTPISNINMNVCNLASQTCNVNMAGTSGNSVCFAFLLGPNASVLTCDATADAGSATIHCAATAAGDAGVICIN